MSWNCVKAIRRWADEDIESTGRDVLRRQAHKLADAVNAAMEELHTEWFDRHKKATELLADTARRNVRAEAEVKRLTEENADLRECMIEALQDHCVNCSNVTWGPLKTNPELRVINGCEMRHCCPRENWRKALKGFNHA